LGKRSYMDVAKLFLGAILILFGLVLIGLKVAFGWLSPPTAAMLFEEGTEDESASAWDFLLALLDNAGWLVIVGIILIVAGLLLCGVALDLSFLASASSASFFTA
jgi:uncharacterized membrane protein